MRLRAGSARPLGAAAWLLAALLLLPGLALAQTGAASILDAGGALGVPAMKVTTNPDGSQDYTVTIQILALMTAQRAPGAAST